MGFLKRYFLISRAAFETLERAKHWTAFHVAQYIYRWKYVASGRIHAVGDPMKPHTEPPVHNYRTQAAFALMAGPCHASSL